MFMDVGPRTTLPGIKLVDYYPCKFRQIIKLICASVFSSEKREQ